MEREIGDLEALITEAGGSAHLYGVSSGGALVLDVAAAGIGVDKLAVYEVPCAVAGDIPQRCQEFVEQLGPVLPRVVPGTRPNCSRDQGAPPTRTSQRPNTPFWSGLQAIEHTIAYDAACMGSDHREHSTRGTSHHWRPRTRGQPEGGTPVLERFFSD